METSLLKHMEELLHSLKAEGYRSYDHYDFWTTPSGIFLRRHHTPLTRPVVGAFYAADVLWPGLFRVGVDKKLPMENLPALLEAMLIYHDLTGQDDFEDDRLSLTDTMIASLGKSSHGRGLGHPFNWYTGTLMEAGTPLVPLTAAMVACLLDLPQEEAERPQVQEALQAAGSFLYQDTGLEGTEGGGMRLCYAETDRRYVTNAHTGAGLALLRLGRYLGQAEYTDAAHRLFKHVIHCQQADGGWSYFLPGSVPDKENFIDGFHTAFVLEDMLDYARLAQKGNARRAFEYGMDFFEECFVDADGRVRPFAKKHVDMKIEVDTRSAAEAVKLFALADRERPGSFKRAEAVLEWLKKTMYDDQRKIYRHRTYSFARPRMHFARWATVPVVSALACLERAMRDRSGV